MDFFANPSAMFADLLLPASTSWETESIKTNFGFPKGASEDALRWVQARKVVVPPPPGTRSDLEVLFDLACRLGLGEHFFGGDMDAGVAVICLSRPVSRWKSCGRIRSA